MIKNKVFKASNINDINDFISKHNVIKKHSFISNYENYLKIYYKEK